ncbi:MAG: WYL domain-containing protein, partial [Acidimicrobiales bacterium]
MKPPGTTAGRLRRMLAILTWLAQVGEAPIDDVAARFDLTPDALVTELELAACCGVPPYTPDQLMEIVVTDTTVSTHLGSALSRPRRLSPDEGFALAASARGLLAVPGSDEGGALSRALAKLEAALGGERLVIELDTPAMLSTVRGALASGSRLEISYYSASSDRHGKRVIVPFRVFASEGHWYVDAACSPGGESKRFRVDRIDEARIADGPDDPEDGAGVGGGPPGAGGRPYGRGRSDGPPGGFEAFVPGPDTRRVRL